jgi:hypothetical protein
MSDEAKNVEQEEPNVAESAEPLPESELEQVTGGTTLHQATVNGKHIATGKITV